MAVAWFFDKGLCKYSMDLTSSRQAVRRIPFRSVRALILRKGNISIQIIDLSVTVPVIHNVNHRKCGQLAWQIYCAYIQFMLMKYTLIKIRRKGVAFQQRALVKQFRYAGESVVSDSLDDGGTNVIKMARKVRLAHYRCGRKTIEALINAHIIRASNRRFTLWGIERKAMGGQYAEYAQSLLYVATANGVTS